ncbi:flagellar protein FlgN [Azospirillum isscasi]|uniref:Flagellar protein FlgN n=1 Tax=Azospirillum isscasi TaxID=3053926 RepID=A0ABU0WL10_9PROT|nr:flagellar protein FlgN [Azospirillum isscasi]MDQ2103614.1 flagellar protein FlgN [Azospirillum isscasi]
MSRRFKDLIREFAPDAKPVEEIAPALPEPEAPALADGPTAVVMTEFLDTVAELSALLEEETAALSAGTLDGLEGYARRKQAMADRLGGIMAQAGTLRLNDDLRAMILDRVERLDRAINENAAGLVAMRKAVLSINRSLLVALEKAASDGLYAPTGHAVRPVELSASGLNAEL